MWAVVQRERTLEPLTLKNDLVALDLSAARVTAVDRGRYLVHNGEGEVPAELTGKLLHLGSSGVGKTTLINRLLGDGDLETGAVSHTGEGRHTTTRRHLMRLANGALLIDMPGMRELGMLGADVGIEETFADVAALAGQCRFSDCTHDSEPGCAVRAALERNDITEQHLRNYLKLRKESEFHDLSLSERRNKDKAFGRFMHHYKKHKGGADKD